MIRICVGLVAATLVAAPLAAQGPLAGQASPTVLQISIDRIKADNEERYDAIATEVAALCRRLDCPHPYLALESFGTPKEVYWLTAYRNEADVARIAEAYANNEPLREQLRRASAPKSELIEAPIEIMARYRPDLSDASPWLVGTLPFTLIVEGGVEAGSGAVFDLPDGRQIGFIPVANAEDLNAIAAALGPSAKRFAVRPAWSKPAALWIIGNPALWPPSLNN